MGSVGVGGVIVGGVGVGGAVKENTLLAVSYNVMSVLEVQLYDSQRY